MAYTITYVCPFQERNAIKVINFNDVSDVVADDSQGKQNCFRYVHTYMYIYMCVCGCDDEVVYCVGVED